MEVKDVRKITSSGQLRDLEDFAQSRGVPLELFTNAPAPSSGRLADSIREERVILRRIP